MTEDDPSLPGGDQTDPTTNGSQLSLAARYPMVVQAYQKYLGRTPSDQEILSQTGNGTFGPSDGRLQLSLQNIQYSDEAKQYQQQHQPTAPASGAPNTAPPPGPVAGAYSPWSTPYTPPPQLDLGGQKGLAFIPPAPTFSFDAPTEAQAQQEPGYKFSFDEGLRALDQGAAAKGLLNSGGNLTSEQLYGQNAATLNYGNVYNRAFNLAQAKFQPLYGEWQTLGAAGQRQDEEQQQRALALYQQHYGEWRDWQSMDWNRKYQSATA